MGSSVWLRQGVKEGERGDLAPGGRKRALAWGNPGVSSKKHPLNYVYM